MPTYRYDDTRIEDGYGSLTISFLFSDTWDGLFTSDSLSVNTVKVDKLKFKKEDKIGQLAIDDFKFSINEAGFSKDDSTIITGAKTQFDIDTDLLNLCLNSAIGSLCYVGIFVETGATPDIDDALYTGTVNNEHSGEDIKWNGSEWSSSPSPLRNYKFECTPGAESVLDVITATAVIDNIDSTWESTYVFNAPGFYKDTDGTTTFESRIPNIVNFRLLLNELARSYVELLDDAGHGTWTLTFGLSKLAAKVSPVRWGGPKDDLVFGPLVRGVLIKSGSTPTQVVNPTMIYDDEAIELNIASTSHVTDFDYNFPYISYSVIKPSENTDDIDRNEVNQESAQNFLWKNNSRVKDSFTSLLYSLATELKLIPKFEFTGQKDIKITFVSAKDLYTEDEIYIKDVTKASLEQKVSEKRDDAKKLNGLISYLIAEPTEEVDYEGNPTFGIADVLNKLNPHFTEQGIPLRNKPPIRGEGVQNLLTIGAAQWEINEPMTVNDGTNSILIKDLSYSDALLRFCAIPYNLHLSDDSGNKQMNFVTLYTAGSQYYGNAVPYNSVSASNQLYLKVDKRVGETNCPDTYYTQIGRLEIERDGEDKYYYSLADYVNGINHDDLINYSTKYKLTIPYLMGISTSPSGTSPSILNLGIGKRVQIDGLYYNVDSYEVDFDKRVLQIELVASGRYNYGEAAGKEDSKLGEVQGAEDESTGTEVEKGLTLRNSGIKAGELVSLLSATEVERSEPKEAHYGRLYGFALHDADEDGTLNVQRSGKLVISWLSGSVNDRVYLRKVSAVQNLSTTPLASKTVDEDLFAQVGKLVDTNTIEINIGEHFILQ
jgi:hypothetical protein